MENKNNLSQVPQNESRKENSPIDPLSIAAITNVVFKRLSQDEQYQIAVEKACGEQIPGQWLIAKAKEAYKRGFDVIQSEFLNFSSHGMGMMLYNKKAPKFINVSEEEYLSKVEAIEDLTRQMNSLLPNILLSDEEAEKEWSRIKENRQRLIKEIEDLLDTDTDIESC